MLREGRSNSVLEPASEVDCSLWGWLEPASIADWQAGTTSRPRGILGTDDKKAWTPGLNVLGTVMCAPVLNHLRREQNAPGAHNVIHPGCGGAVHYFWMLRRILPVSQNTNHSSWGGADQSNRRCDVCPVTHGCNIQWKVCLRVHVENRYTIYIYFIFESVSYYDTHL